MDLGVLKLRFPVVSHDKATEVLYHYIKVHHAVIACCRMFQARE